MVYLNGSSVVYESLWIRCRRFQCPARLSKLETAFSRPGMTKDPAQEPELPFLTRTGSKRYRFREHSVYRWLCHLRYFLLLGWGVFKGLALIHSFRILCLCAYLQLPRS